MKYVLVSNCRRSVHAGTVAAQSVLKYSDHDVASLSVIVTGQTEGCRSSLIVFPWPQCGLPCSLYSGERLHLYSLHLEPVTSGNTWCNWFTWLLLSPPSPLCVYPCSYQCSLFMCGFCGCLIVMPFSVMQYQSLLPFTYCRAQ